MASIVSDDSVSQEQAETHVRLVDCHLAVPKCMKPLAKLKTSLRQLFFTAEFRLGGTYRLGTLNRLGPDVTPMNLEETWTEAKKYIKVHGDDRDLFRTPGYTTVDLHLTLSVESNQELSDSDINVINNELMTKGIYDVQLWPSSMIEVEGELHE